MTVLERITAASNAVARPVGRIPRPALVAILVAYGIGVAFVGVREWRFDTLFMMTTRVNDISASLRTLEAGGPPLLDCGQATDAQLGTIPFETLVDRGLCRPAGFTDDQGLSLFVPWVAQLTGAELPDTALHQLFTACFFLLFAFSPLVFLGILRSLPAALAAPWLLIATEDTFVVPLDHYWVSAWGMLVGLPLAWLLFARWDDMGRWRWALAIGTGLIASIVTAMRINAGLAVAVAIVLVVLLKASSWRRRIVMGALVVVAYLAIYPFGLDGVRAYRDHVVDEPLAERYPARHPLWHNAYIGLGVIPNPYGIEWNDGVSIAFARTKDPDVVYLSDRYEHILRDEYFRLLKEDTGFVVKTWLFKADQIVRQALSSFWLGLLALVLAIAIGTRRHVVRGLVAVAAPAPLLGAVPPMMTIAEHPYQLGWLGALGALATLGTACVVAEVATLLRDPTSIRRKWRATLGLQRTIRSPWFAVVLVVLAAGGGVLAARAAVIEGDGRDSYYRLYAAAPSPSPSGSKVHSWSVAQGLPPTWRVSDALRAEPDGGALAVDTSTGRSAYQLVGEEVVLSPGRYAATVDGSITDGGLEVGVLDVKANAWISTAHFWEGQAPFTAPLPLRFELTGEKTVRVILSNWSPTDSASSWRLRAVALLRESPD